MNARIIVDTGPLVAFLNRADAHHAWAAAQFGRVRPPLLTCEAVLSEASFLLASFGRSPTLALDMAARGALAVGFSLADELEAVRRLMTRYKDVPVSLADACLIRMSELLPNCSVMTLDRDFLVYRRDGRRTIPLIAPFA